MTAPELRPLLPRHLLQRLCTAEEMRAMDHHAIEALGVPGRVLMENAAHEVAAAVQRLLPTRPLTHPVTVCCGGGNNGGDGYAVARLLTNAGIPTQVVQRGAPGTDDCRANADTWSHFGVTIDFDTDPKAAIAALNRSPAFVDALFGTGLSRTLEGPARELIAAMNAAPAPLKLGVDVPSGINADTGAVMGDAVRCSHTVCFQVGKIGLYQHPGAGYAGQVSIVPVSIPKQWPVDALATYRLTERFAQRLVPGRPAAGHKGTFGHLLAICGSAGMGGAALLSGQAALKVGTGLVTVGVPQALQDRFLAAAPELMTLAAPGGAPDAFDTSHAPALAEAAASRSAVVLGCGLGRAPDTTAFVNALVPRIEKPLLIDADGLYGLDLASLRGRAIPAVLTPHPGELSRLSGLSVEQLAQNRVEHARRLAATWQVVLVMKGAATVVASPKGEVFINPTGDAGLATGGTGDVLSGVIGGLLAQGLAPLPATLLGIYLHGLARDEQRTALSSASFTAHDLVLGLNLALQRLGG
ncbi:MAG TPA: NAD(P)H-hydrate dehydratase [bacterium]